MTIELEITMLCQIMNGKWLKNISIHSPLTASLSLTHYHSLTTHSFTLPHYHSLPHYSLIHSPTLSLTASLLTHSLSHTITHCLTHSSLTEIHSPITLSITHCLSRLTHCLSYTHPSLTHSLTYLPIYPLTHMIITIFSVNKWVSEWVGSETRVS